MHITQIPYTEDSAALFNHFAEQSYAVFIDSCGRDRFDIITAYPQKIICTRSPTENPFSLAKEELLAQQLAMNSQISEELPFTIGAMGFFSYDLGYQLHQLSSSQKNDLNLPTAYIGIYDWSLNVDHLRKKTFLVSLHPLNHPKMAVIYQKILQPRLADEPFKLVTPFSANMDLSEYSQRFQKVKQHLHAGDCYQINLAMRFAAAYQGSPWTAYRLLRKNNPMPMAAFIKLPESAILSLSPERFLQVSKNRVITQPIKGTSPRFDDQKADQQSAQQLLASLKDRAENLMIVDLLRNDLGKCCIPGSIKVPKLCALESFTSVHHLVSTIVGDLSEGQHPFDLLQHCFPGGSITGAPKKRAMEIIDQLEPHPRSIYCGSIAFCDIRGKMDSNISIRTLLCEQDKIYCYGGGGIVSDSSMENEFQEIHCKISRLLTTLESIDQ